ncbi:hypothetical protein NC653_020054 [Populus alba x Populus x berolinensis]|uniref:Amino acid transporter transmembrane domain-containing protein n=1 Tax=Populus alba x Populus x berolinensis TaxID=444605 RepID=A0AAD6QC53_9ROSI|nr:hypothetical protein NC653_020054 [Populus alba x Populus x berolinensis]
MGTQPPTSVEVSERDREEGPSSSEQLDAGALFVLKSRGSWLHCGYHLTTSIVAPALLSLPYALSLMGWFPGVLCLILAALITFYSYNLLSLVLEHHARTGRRQLRFRVMAEDILGPAWGRYFVGPIQFGVCYGSVIACILLGGQSLKFIYLLSTPKGSMQLYEFVSIFGILMLVLAQIPSFHSLRHISLVSLVLALAYSACTTAGSVHIGNSKNAPPKDYSINGAMQNRVFGAFNAISIIATTYGNGIIPEIQATVAPPVEGKMFKGLLVCYAVIIMTFFSVAISGYWAFGNQTKGVILNNFMVDEKPLLPTWVLLMINVLTLLQVAAVSVRQMATVVPNSMNVSKVDNERGVIDSSTELDAGALFVLQSRGSWIHCGFHLTTSIVGPVIFSLPFALALLGWVPGVLILTLAALVTFYAYNLLSAVLEHHEKLGKRQIRFRDMARDILGPGWGKFFVGPLQFSICYGAVIACTLIGGQSLKFIYLLYNSNGTMQLYQFIIIFGAATLFLAQMPSFHSLRHINLFSLILCLAYSACVAAGSIHTGKSKNAPSKDYSIKGSQENQFFSAINAISIISTTYASGIIPEIQATIAPPIKGKMFKGLCICYAVIGSYWSFGNQAQPTILANFMGDGQPLLPRWFLLLTNIFTLMQVTAIALNAPPKDYSINGAMQNRVFGAFNAISIIATTYGNGIIPEIQATVAPPVEGKMFKGLLVCYAVIIMTFFSVAISGYWAFGNQTKGVILNNFMVDEKPLLPTWVLLMINVLTLLQVAAVSVHHEKLGKRQIRFRDMARDILGPGWGKFFVGPLQFSICFGAVIACTLIGGQSLKFIYLLYNSNGTMQLYQFIIIFGAATLFLAQMPSFHSLRHINLFSLILCLAYSACVAAGSIHTG